MPPAPPPPPIFLLQDLIQNKSRWSFYSTSKKSKDPYDDLPYPS